MRFYFLVLFIFPVFFLACKKEKEVKLVSGLYRASERMVGEVHLYTMSGEIMDREVVEAFLGRNEDPDFDDLPGVYPYEADFTIDLRPDNTATIKKSTNSREGEIERQSPVRFALAMNDSVPMAFPDDPDHCDLLFRGLYLLDPDRVCRPAPNTTGLSEICSSRFRYHVLVEGDQLVLPLTYYAFYSTFQGASCRTSGQSFRGGFEEGVTDLLADGDTLITRTHGVYFVKDH